MNRIRKKFKDAGFTKNGKGTTKNTWLRLDAWLIVHLANSILKKFWNYYSFTLNKRNLVSWIYWVIKEVVLRTLSRKFIGRSSVQAILKRFGKDVTIRDLENRNNDGSPKILARLAKPNYRIDCWDFSTSLKNTTVPALYSTEVSLATLDGLTCMNCGSDYRVKMHYVKIMKDLNPKLNDLDKLMVKEKSQKIPICWKCYMDHHSVKLSTSANTLKPKGKSCEKN